MLILAAAALATVQAPPKMSASAQATATIRIVGAVRLKLDGSRNPDAPPARNARIKAANGSLERAKLIEFQ
jgi:hypothetical protein